MSITRYVDCSLCHNVKSIRAISMKECWLFSYTYLIWYKILRLRHRAADPRRWVDAAAATLTANGNSLAPHSKTRTSWASTYHISHYIYNVVSCLQTMPVNQNEWLQHSHRFLSLSLTFSLVLGSWSYLWNTGGSLSIVNLARKKKRGANRVSQCQWFAALVHS